MEVELEELTGGRIVVKKKIDVAKKGEMGGLSSTKYVERRCGDSGKFS